MGTLALSASANTPQAGTEGRRAASRGYVPALDGVRAFAVMIVMLHHISVPYVTGGFIGVAVFFVLSGYLISSLLLDELARTGRVRLPAFFRRRGMRLYPALVLAVVLALVVAQVDGTAVSETRRGAPLALAYLTNLAAWRGWSSAGMLAHTWSLAIEAQFYLLWPLVLVWLARRGALGIGCLGLAAAFLALSILNTTVAHIGSTYFFPPFFAIPLVVGAGLASLQRHGALDRRPGALSILTWAGLAAIVAIALSADSTLSSSMLDIGYPVVFGASALLVAGLVRGDVPMLSRLFSWRPAVWIGQRSYGIYLYHYAFALALVDHATAVRLPLVLALTFVVAELSWRFVELPFLRRGRGVRGHVEAGGAAVAAAPARG